MASRYPAPSMLKPEVIDHLCKILSRGHSIRAACGLSGVGLRTYYHWMRLGKAAVEAGNERDPYARAYTQIMQAQAEAEAFALECWRSHLGRDYRASRDFMAARWGEDWGDKRKVIMRVEVEVGKLLKELEARLESHYFQMVCDAVDTIMLERELESGQPGIEFEEDEDGVPLSE